LHKVPWATEKNVYSIGCWVEYSECVW
jgi:hypothetical protein